MEVGSNELKEGGTVVISVRCDGETSKTEMVKVVDGGGWWPWS